MLAGADGSEGRLQARGGGLVSFLKARLSPVAPSVRRSSGLREGFSLSYQRAVPILYTRELSLARCLPRSYSCVVAGHEFTPAAPHRES